MSWPDFIFYLKQCANVSVNELALSCGVKPSTFYAILKGDRLPKGPTVNKIKIYVKEVFEEYDATYIIKKIPKKKSRINKKIPR